MSLGKSVTLTWSAPEDDGGCKIGNYVVEYFRIGWDVWLKASSTRQLTATLNDLIEGSEYKFRVKAESPYGLSEPSDESKILFIPDPKRGIITPSSERNNRTIKASTLSPNAGRKNVVYSQSRKSPIKQIVISDVPKNVEFISQIYDNEQIVKELSYGTSVENRNTKRKDSLSDLKQNSDLNSIEPNNLLVNNSKLIESGRESPNPSSTVATSLRSNSNEKETQDTSDDDKNKLAATHDEVHTSNEFMLVLYDDKNKEKQEYEGKLANKAKNMHLFSFTAHQHLFRRKSFWFGLERSDWSAAIVIINTRPTRYVTSQSVPTIETIRELIRITLWEGIIYAKSFISQRKVQITAHDLCHRNKVYWIPLKMH